MNDHPYESLPAFALGALDADEAHQVFTHVALCPTCRDDVEQWVAVAAMLPYAAEPCEPPSHIKRRLFALVDTVAKAPESSAAPAPRAAGWLHRANVVALGALTLALVFGALFITMRQRADLLTAELAERDQQMQFMSAATAQRFAAQQPVAGATMYIKPGDPHALLVVRDLEPLAENQVYQLWCEKAKRQLPLTTFTVDDSGEAMVDIDAPAPLDQYDLVMVTVEPSGGSPMPSANVVLQADPSP